VKDDFRKTLADCEKTGHSVKEATKDTLEGVQDGLKAAGHKAGDVVAKSADAIADVTHEITVQSLDVARSYADDAKDLFDKAVAKSSDATDKLEAKTKEEMKKTYVSLHQKTIAEKQKLHQVSEGIKAHAENKTHELIDDTRSALHHSAEKSVAHLQALTEASETHSKKLLHHSYAKVSEWLGKLKDKANHTT